MALVTTYCECGWKVVAPESVKVKCPKCSPTEVPWRQTKEKPQSHWPPLHLYPVEHASDWDIRAAKKWYREWCRGIPRYNCKCQDNWTAYTSKTENIPNFNSPQAFFEWGVTAHNFVSENHAIPKKPTITIQEAETLYSAPWSNQTVG
jgi:hypothetical protein